MEANVFHGMDECKVGEATSSRYEDITNTFDQVTITEQHSCLVYFLQDVGNHIKIASLHQCKFYLMGVDIAQERLFWFMRLFLTDKEDKINLKEETPSRTSRIQLRKEMNMILTPPLTKEIEEDDASQIYYMSKLIGEV
ncbi:hypothetical protein CMV_022322 [Castanea mollissima]|uniref:Uncharacterized protein n=1 Tax=Castanea mollissima TaxID=60419 RepID=A0A8J4QV25_9ROSI|nr:hypothetical protein CMV_022322 [Castanea mollissima]